MTLHQLHMTYTYDDGMYSITMHIPEKDVESLKGPSAIDGIGGEAPSFAEALCDLADVVHEIEKRNDEKERGDDTL